MRVRTLVFYLLACLTAFVVLAGLFYAPPAPLNIANMKAPSAPQAPQQGGGGQGGGQGAPPNITSPPLSAPSPGTPSPGVGLPTLSGIITYVPLIGAIGAVWKYAKDWREQVVLSINGITVKTHSYYFG